MSSAKNEKYELYVANLKEHLQEKSVQDLLDDLQSELDAALAKGEEFDLDVYDAYMDVINEIEPLEEDPIDPDVIIRKVQQEHPELFPHSESTRDIPQRSRSRFSTKRFLMTAAVLFVAAILLAMATFGSKTMKGFRCLGGDLFEIGYAPSSGQMELETPGENGYRSLAEALAANGLSGIAPTWVPEGYNLNAVDVVSTAMYCNYTAAFSNGDNGLLVRITYYADGKFPDSGFERVDEYDEIYHVCATDHFLMKNHERMQATWERNNCLCNISGPLSESELKQMIDSIYEGRE